MNPEDLLRETLRSKASEAFASLEFAEIRGAAAFRRRHTTRRVVLLAAAAVLVVAAPAAFLLGLNPDAPSPTPSPTTSVTPTGILGPTGYGSLKLGMSYADALSTGRLQASNPNQNFGWAVKDHPQAEVCLTKAGGLMAIFGDATMATPEGIHIGSTLAQVEAAYPHQKLSIAFVVPLSPTTRYDFLIDSKNKKVYQWTIQTTTETCFG